VYLLNRPTTHIDGSLNAAGINNFLQISSKSPVAFRKPLIWVQSAFGNSFMIAQVTSSKIAPIKKCFHGSSCLKILLKVSATESAEI
jgi:hypothetical protein